MSASLIVLIPVVLLGLVTTLCFVGCVLGREGTEPDPGLYQDAIGEHSNLIAFWPLNDTQAVSPTATDVAHPLGPTAFKFNGTYTGNFMLQQNGIVPGDVHFNIIRNACAFFNGGLVQVPFHQELNASSFTLECWVKPNWTAADPQTPRAVVASAFGDERPNPDSNAGYGLIATADNFWSAQIGIGTSFVAATSADPILLDGVTAYYLAMTFDGNALTLFVGIAGGGLTSTFPASLGPGEKFVSESKDMSSVDTSTSLFIAMGRPDLPTTMLYPFNGLIQDVAYYSPALGDAEVKSHFALGKTPPAGQ